MIHRSLLLPLLTGLLLASLTVRAEEQKPVQFQRVFVFDATTKPSVALKSGRYLCRLINPDHAALISKSCQAKMPGASGLSTRALTFNRAESIAFICPHCGRLIWQDTGREVNLAEQSEKLTDKDVQAIVKITEQLVAPANSHL